MENRPHNIEQLPRDNRGAYRVPDGYFSELSHKLNQNAQKPAQGGSWATFRSMMSFAACFAVMVALAMTGFYFTGYKAQTNDASSDELYVINLYNITAEDIIEYGDTTAISSPLFADAAIDYLDTYGYNLTDILPEQ